LRVKFCHHTFSKNKDKNSSTIFRKKKFFKRKKKKKTFFPNFFRKKKKFNRPTLAPSDSIQLLRFDLKRREKKTFCLDPSSDLIRDPLIR
jgi:hypothetical protein